MSTTAGQEPAVDDGKRKRLSDRVELLWKLTEACEADVAKYLLLANSGGAVATLSFMGAAADLRALPGPHVALVAFLLGVVLCGATLGVRANNASSAYVQFLEDANKYQSAIITWNELVERSSPTRGALLTTILAALTYLCLIAGAVAGASTVWGRIG
jgi:hypothetical protein